VRLFQSERKRKERSELCAMEKGTLGHPREGNWSEQGKKGNWEKKRGGQTWKRDGYWRQENARGTGEKYKRGGEEADPIRESENRGSAFLGGKESQYKEHEKGRVRGRQGEVRFFDGDQGKERVKKYKAGERSSAEEGGRAGGSVPETEKGGGE